MEWIRMDTHGIDSLSTVVPVGTFAGVALAQCWSFVGVSLEFCWIFCEEILSDFVNGQWG